eukprot:1755828-Amphidinium_carterae.1
MVEEEEQPIQDGQPISPEDAPMVPIIGALGPVATTDEEETRLIAQAVAQRDVPRAPHLRDDMLQHDPTAASSSAANAATAAPQQPLHRVPLTPVTGQPAGDLMIPGSRAGRGPDLAQRHRRTTAESSAQSAELPSTDWRHFDTNRAVRQLASPNAKIRALTLRRLHVRWYHAGPTQMKRILSAAGVTEPALSECSAICSTCN